MKFSVCPFTEDIQAVKDFMNNVRAEGGKDIPEDVEMLQDLVVAAVNQAVTRAQEMMNNEVSKVTGGMGLPPGMM